MSLVWSPDYAPVDGDFADVSLLLKGEGTNGSTTILDSSSNNLSVTANGDAQISTAVNTPFGTGDGVLAFDGTGDYLQAAESNSNLTFDTGDFTVEFFIYYNSTNTDDLLLDWRNSVGGQDRIVLFQTGGNLTLFNPNNTTTTIFTPSTNIWYHVSLCRSSGTLRAYVDGIQVFSVANAVNYLPPGSTNGIYIGGIAFASGYDFDGYLSNLRITKGVARYTENFDVPTAPFPILSPSGRITIADDSLDADARQYIINVEEQDGEELEAGVRTAINDFVVGCKNDGIWNAIKASCLLCGARTLEGALVSLKGSAPTNNGPFTASDYNRRTGLLGNGSTKYLDTNRANNADPQNSKHVSVYITEADPVNTRMVFGSDSFGTSGGTSVLIAPATPRVIPRANCGGSGGIVNGLTADNSFVAVDRSVSNLFVFRHNQTSSDVNYTSQTPTSNNILIFARPGPSNVSSDRIAFYSIGETLPNDLVSSGLELLDARISAFITAIGAAI